MAGESVSSNMNLPIPGVGVTAGPTYADDLASCLTIVDAHTHASGSGVQITPAGLNINSDLTYSNNNLTNVRSVRFFAQSAPIAGVSDLGCLYESGVDLYYNDGSGNQVRMTQSGAVAGTPGSIASLASPASATYVAANQTFVWQSGSNTSANLDGASVLLRNLVASSKALTLSPPNAMGSNYSLVLPSLPGSTSVMTLDASGNMGTSSYDAVGQAMTLTGANAIRSSMTVSASSSTASGGNMAISSSCGTFTNSSGVVTLITNFTVTLTTSGRPVLLKVLPDGTGSVAKVQVNNAATNAGANLLIKRNGTLINTINLSIAITGSSNVSVSYAPNSLETFDNVAGSAGTYIYTMSVQTITGTFTLQNCVLLAKEDN